MFRQQSLKCVDTQHFTWLVPGDSPQSGLSGPVDVPASTSSLEDVMKPSRTFEVHRTEKPIASTKPTVIWLMIAA